MTVPTQREKSSSAAGLKLGVALGLLIVVAVGFLAMGGRGRIVELLVIGVAMAAGYAVQLPLANLISPLGANVVLGLEAVYGHFGLRSVGYALATAAAVALTGRARDPIRQDAASRSQPGTLEYELRRSLRYDHPFSLLIVHPDGRGPKVGVVFETITANLRVTDVATARNGRDFWLLLPETDADASRVASERIRLAAGARGSTVSIGIAVFPDDGHTARDLATAAQRALVGALELGGNRTVLHTLPGDAPPGWGLPHVA